MVKEGAVVFIVFLKFMITCGKQIVTNQFALTYCQASSGMMAKYPGFSTKQAKPFLKKLWECFSLKHAAVYYVRYHGEFNVDFQLSNCQLWV